MDLSRAARRFAALLTAALLAAGCGSDTPMGFGEDAALLPSTLFDALPLAQAQARAIADNAYVTRLGGGFTVMDENGRAHSHSFVFYATVGRSARRITVHLIHGSPWVLTENLSLADRLPPFEDAQLVLDSDRVVTRALQLAPDYSIPALSDPTFARAYAARLSVVPAWPEPQSVLDTGTEIAWRVDFLQLRPSSRGVDVWFSVARFYFDPETGDLFGNPVIPSQPEIYPFP